MSQVCAVCLPGLRDFELYRQLAKEKQQCTKRRESSPTQQPKPASFLPEIAPDQRKNEGDRHKHEHIRRVSHASMADGKYGRNKKL
jgi:hypothetical protein